MLEAARIGRVKSWTCSEVFLYFTPLGGRSIRIMYSHRDPWARRSGTAYVLIVNLDKAINYETLHFVFSHFGNILSCKIATDNTGQSKGYGFVQFDSKDSAQRAIDTLNNMLFSGKKVYVGHVMRKQEGDTSGKEANYSIVYVKNLSDSTTEEDLQKVFGEYGVITSSVVMRGRDGKSKCFGFVKFGNAVAAARAVEALSGRKFGGKDWSVGKAQKKSERELEVKSQFEQRAKEPVDKLKGLNLYIQNLDVSIDDEKLKELFSEFGTITFSKVMRDSRGISGGSGFVAFSTAEEASRALAELNGKVVLSKPMYVALAQRKEEGRARLQTHFSQMRPVQMSPSVAPRMPVYQPGAPGLGQPLFHDQTPPAMIPPQAHFSQMRPVQMSPSVDPRMPVYQPGAPGPGQPLFHDQTPPAMIPPQAHFSQMRPVQMSPSVAPLMPVYQPGAPGPGQPLFHDQTPPAMNPPQERFLQMRPVQMSPSVPPRMLVYQPGVPGLGQPLFHDQTPPTMIPPQAHFSQMRPVQMSPSFAPRMPVYQPGAPGPGQPLFQDQTPPAMIPQSHFSQMRPVQLSPSLAPRMLVYQPGAPGPGQPLFHDQTPPSMIPPQAGFGYQQQLVPAIWPAGVPMPNFLVLMVQQGQQGPHPVHQTQQPMAMMQHQVAPERQMLVSALATALANATPQQQRMMLGERLYPLVDQIEHEDSAKITGMLLEMDQRGVLHLLENPEALKLKVSEALTILRNVASRDLSSSADQMASLSINKNSH